MKRRPYVVAALAVGAAAVAGYLAFGPADRSNGRFPELRPVLDPPPHYAWEFHDGPDFYVWVLADPEVVRDRARSGIGIYFGLHPNLDSAKGATERVPGRVGTQKVTWLIERADGADAWVRRDAVLDYDHGREFLPIRLHVWVWGPSDEQVAGLAGRLEGLSFTSR